MNKFVLPKVFSEICYSLFVIRLSVFTLLFVVTSSAYANPITLRHKHHLFTINPATYTDWQSGTPQWMYNSMPIAPLPEWLTEGDEPLVLPEGVTVQTIAGWNKEAIVRVVESKISASLNREAGSVVIKGEPGTASGITFDGIGLLGRTVDAESLADLLIQAIERNVTDITIPVLEKQPEITVESAALKTRGIKEVVTVGESQFIGSTYDRQHNIRTGLSKFNGHIIPQGSVFSFNEVLGPVDGSTGYRKELVILGDRTKPEFGGGLCQVSTTAYRGIWEYGFPIEARRNHSYTVSYYHPQGTDATIYPGVQDMKFTNDSPGDLLMQTHMEGVNAYYIYYGTRDTRKSEIVGPFIWGRTNIPPARTEYTTDLAPGAKKKLGSPVPGMKTAWYRALTPVDADAEEVEEYYSHYQARPLFYQIGVGASSTPTGYSAANQDDPNAVPIPSWLNSTKDEVQSSSAASVPASAPVKFNRRSVRR